MQQYSLDIERCLVPNRHNTTKLVGDQKLQCEEIHLLLYGRALLLMAIPNGDKIIGYSKLEISKLATG